MTIQEMHIEIEQATQNVGASLRRKLYPAEIDWIINKMMHRYISNRVTSFREKPGAADALVHLNRMSTLLDSVDLPMYRVGTEYRVCYPIPHRVEEILSVEAAVENLCGSTPVSVRQNYVLNVLQIPKTNASEEFYKDFVISVQGSPVFNLLTYYQERGQSFNGLESKDDLWQIIPIVLAELDRKGYRVFWEEYNLAEERLFFPGKLIMDGLPATALSVRIDGNTTLGTQTDERYRTQYQNQNTSLYPGRFYFQTSLPQMKTSAFSNTYYRSPLCYQQNGALVVDYTDSFIVRYARVHHVRRPRTVSLSLSEHCELPESAHPDICDLATEYIKGLRADPDWENKLRDNMTRTIL